VLLPDEAERRVTFDRRREGRGRALTDGRRIERGRDLGWHANRRASSRTGSHVAEVAARDGALVADLIDAARHRIGDRHAEHNRDALTRREREATGATDDHGLARQALEHT